MSVNYTLDNKGHIVAVPGTGHPVAASAQVLTNATANTNTTATVVAGATYAITMYTADAGFSAGIATTATAANRIWTCPPNGSIVIFVPEGITTLHYRVSADNAVAHLSRLERP